MLRVTFGRLGKKWFEKKKKDAIKRYGRHTDDLTKLKEKVDKKLEVTENIKKAMSKKILLVDKTEKEIIALIRDVKKELLQNMHSVDKTKMEVKAMIRDIEQEISSRMSEEELLNIDWGAIS